MLSSSARDMDLLFDVLHQNSLQNSQKNFMGQRMSRGLYFHDQYARVSHIGGVHRYKRHPDDFTQALQQSKIALAAKDDKPTKIDSIALSPTPSQKPKNDVLLRDIQRKLKAPIVPEVLCRELDVLLQRFEDRFKTSSSLKFAPKSDQPPPPPPESEQEATPVADVSVQEPPDEDKSKAATSNAPRILLPDSLLIGLHSTWGDLIENAEDNYKTWRTKAAEDLWNRQVERKRLQQLNAEKHRNLALNKTSNQPQKGSRLSITSLSNIAHQQSVLVKNPRMRTNRSLSRVSFSSTSMQNTRFFKSMHHHHGSLDESKAGLHVEFKLSIETDDPTQKTPISNTPKGVIFDVPKPAVDLYEDMIALIQMQCKRLLAETKQNIIRTTGNTNIQHPKMCKVWFYEDIPHMRHKTNLLTVNEIARKQKMKFVFSLLRCQIPEKYNIDIEIPKAKHKCYIELTDGSSQVYYPSGRIAVLRLQPPASSTLFFDDTDSPENQFLGCVTSSGCVLVKQPNLYTRFVTDSQHERGYLCNGETGIIEKQLRSHSNNPGTQSNLPNQTPANDDDEIFPPVLDSTVQLQLNSSMQLEYYNPINIRFAFACHKEEFKFQLGAHPSQLPSAVEATLISTKKHSADRKLRSKLSTIVSNSTHSSEISINSQVPVEKLLDGQVNVKELPMIKELTILRKRIKHICISWLKECRTPLGVTDGSSSHRLNVLNMKLNQPKGGKSPRHVSISSKRDSVNSEFLQPGEKEQIVRTNSARKSEPDIIESSMMEFVPHSENGKVMKQKIYAKKNALTILPAIRTHSATTGENLSARSVIPLNLPFACPNLMRQRLLQDSPVSTILYDTCTCRADQVPLIHDLEFDTFIGLTSHLNPRQLIVIGITNSNPRQIEHSQTNELYEILQTLHYHIYSGRSQLCSCRLSINDDYRCLIYDLAQATKQSQSQGPLLIRRHHVQPGFVLIYQNGRLIFGDSIFDGYGTNVQDLKNQLNRMRHQHIALPEEFKFLSDQQRTNTTVLNSI